jgi:hypothetical protein
MALVGHVRVGLKRIELHAFVTEMYAGEQAGRQNFRDETGKSYWIADGYWVQTKPGDRVLLFQGARRGSNRLRDGEFRLDPTLSVAAFNLSTGKEYFAGSGLAGLVVPPFNNAMGVSAILGGLLSALAVFNGAPGGIVILVPSILYFVWTRGRVRKFKRAVRSIARRMQDAPPAAATVLSPTANAATERRRDPGRTLSGRP